MPLVLPPSREEILSHARHFFPSLPVADDWDSQGILQGERLLTWYNRPVTDASFFDSSGTSGQPKAIPWTPQEDEWYIVRKQELFSAFLKDVSQRKRPGAAISLGKGHNAGTAAGIFNNMGWETLDLGLEPLLVQADRLESFQPEVLYASPSIVSSLLRRWRPKRHALSHLILNGELVSHRFLNEIHAAWNLETSCVMDTYGTTEAGTIAFSCPGCGRYHLFPDFLAETVPPGCLGWDSKGLGGEALVISTPARTSFPVVRWAPGDLVTGFGTDECPWYETVWGQKDTFSFDRLTGRIDTVLHCVELFPTSDIERLLETFFPGSDFAFFNPENRVMVVVAAPRPPETLLRELMEEVDLAYPTHAELRNQGLFNGLEWIFDENLKKKVPALGPDAGRHKSKRIFKSSYPGQP